MSLKGMLLIAMFVLTCYTLGESPPSFGAYWKSLSENERVTFLGGFSQGFSTGWQEMLLVLPQDSITMNRIPETEKLRQNEQLKQMLNDYSVDDEEIDFVTLSKTMANLYADPANSYIELPDMICISQHKIRGENIDARLLKARDYVIRGRKTLEELKQKGGK